MSCDEAGLPIGMAYRKASEANLELDMEDQFEFYLFTKNLQGDILNIYDVNGTNVASYTYDAWGNHTVTNYTSDNIGNINPFRYRGYYFDCETGFYYLNSRYYDSGIRRFISADDISYLGANGDVQGFNLYTYCSNNSIMSVDPNGTMIMFRQYSFITLFRYYLYGDGRNIDLSNDSSFINKIMCSNAMNEGITDCINEYKRTGQSTFTKQGVIFNATDNLDLYLAVHGAQFDITITEQTHTEGWWIFKKTYTDYVVNVKIYDTYDFDGSESADILNKFGYYFEEKGYGKVYKWSASYKQTICGHHRKSGSKIRFIPLYL